MKAIILSSDLVLYIGIYFVLSCLTVFAISYYYPNMKNTLWWLAVLGLVLNVIYRVYFI